MAKGYVVVGPAYEYNDGGYNVVGDNSLLQDKVFTSKNEAELECQRLWKEAFRDASYRSYEGYSTWALSDLPQLNRELFSIDSKIYIQNQDTKIKNSLSDLEFNILKKYWRGPHVAKVKEILIG